MEGADNSFVFMGWTSALDLQWRRSGKPAAGRQIAACREEAKRKKAHTLIIRPKRADNR